MMIGPGVKHSTTCIKVKW